MPANYSKKKKKKTLKKNARKKYSATKIKSRHFSTNISYNRLKKKDYENSSFIIDSVFFVFILLNFNPFNLERKFIEKDDKRFVNLLWEKCILHELF